MENNNLDDNKALLSESDSLKIFLKSTLPFSFKSLQKITDGLIKEITEWVNQNYLIMYY